MEVKNVIDPKIVKTNLVGTSKDEVLKELTNLLNENGYISDINGFIDDVYLRESEGQTGIGNYIAIPHAKSKHVKKVGVAIGISKNEIPWESLDGKGVKGIILFAVGSDSNGELEHLKLLSLFARKLGNDDVVNNLICAKKTDDVIAAFA